MAETIIKVAIEYDVYSCSLHKVAMLLNDYNEVGDDMLEYKKSTIEDIAKELNNIVLNAKQV